MHDVVIIGGGLSGTLVAAHLARLLRPASSIALLDEAEVPGPGLAYSTKEPTHLLNVRAANMSALPDDAAHFDTWLAARPVQGTGLVVATAAGTFVSRSLYGLYLQELLAESVRLPRVRLSVRRARALSVARDTESYRIALSHGEIVHARAVVLATGNTAAIDRGTGRIVADPWSPRASEPPNGPDPVVIIGTGLTMVDLAVTLIERGFHGPLLAVSRRGLLPHAHAPAHPIAPALEPHAAGSGLAPLLRSLRAAVRQREAEGGGWRDVVDGLRPVTQDLWRAMDPAGRARFLRHARAYWDAHRHRMAPPVAERIARMQASGQLVVMAGRVHDMRDVGDHVFVTIRPKRHRDTVTIAAQRVIEATGLPGAADAHHPLVLDLVRSGLAGIDRLGFGLDVDATLRVHGRDGVPRPGLWAIGPLVRGAFWECIAVPDIRVQAAQLAQTIAREQALA